MVTSWTPGQPITSSTNRDEPTDPTARADEGQLSQLRPTRLEDYVGQPDIRRNLRVTLDAAKSRGEPVEHVLLHGPPGLGKTTLAHIIAREMDATLRATTGPALEKAADLAALLTNLQPRDVLFIDEIHRLRAPVEEILYSAMEDGVLDLVLGKGPAARTMRMPIAPFTLIGATTKLSSVSAPLRDRFGQVMRLDFYSESEIAEVLRGSASRLDFAVEPDAIEEIARRSRGVPRIANRLLRRVRDFSTVHHPGSETSAKVARDALDALGLDPRGLDDHDRRILTAICEKFSGGPVGLGTLAAALSEEEDTLETVYEPYLLKLGLLERTPRGRVATAAGWELCGLSQPAGRPGLFG